ncbi:hypothetical protein HIM_04242 [Hirsutella minnesotensis 3608]|uniref:Uncharacterized protein n=1 Tax=Hirsutella minnesotensis 3608 TaxID=1043627 RepID=A0A0F7ZVF3_9HYPO|nr:hypothetical protein HIM_04242 [Hirsutella minnesotensis 3608]
MLLGLVAAQKDVKQPEPAPNNAEKLGDTAQTEGFLGGGLGSRRGERLRRLRELERFGWGGGFLDRLGSRFGDRYGYCFGDRFGGGFGDRFGGGFGDRFGGGFGDRFGGGFGGGFDDIECDRRLLDLERERDSRTGLFAQDAAEAPKGDEKGGSTVIDAAASSQVVPPPSSSTNEPATRSQASAATRGSDSTLINLSVAAGLVTFIIMTG